MRLLSLLLLALWLPATLHCDLEAAGLEMLTHIDHETSTCCSTCTDDTCHSVEGASFIKDATTLRALPAPVTELFSCLLSAVPPPLLEAGLGAFATRDSPEIQVLHRTWSFARRTALPARAPDHLT